ncbi:DUF1878 family protein [Priestia megaterium]
MDLVKEVKLLKYQMNLMKHMVKADEHLFFMFAIDHEFEEDQVNALLKIINVFSDRLKNQEISIFSQANHLFSQFNIPLDTLYDREQPTLDEFKSYVTKIFYQDFELKYLLSSLKRQSIHSKVCDYFLKLLREE